MALCKAKRDNFIHRSVTLIFTPSYTDIFYNTSFWKCLYVIKNLVECFNWDGNVNFSIPSKAISYRPEPRKHQWTVPTKMSFRRECCCSSWPSVCRQSSGNWDNRYFLITSVIWLSLCQALPWTPWTPWFWSAALCSGRGRVCPAERSSPPPSGPRASWRPG